MVRASARVVQALFIGWIEVAAVLRAWARVAKDPTWEATWEAREQDLPGRAGRMP